MKDQKKTPSKDAKKAAQTSIKIRDLKPLKDAKGGYISPNCGTGMSKH